MNITAYQKRKKGLFADVDVAAATRQGGPRCPIKESAAPTVRQNIVMI
jgi:hypothetical protein